MNAIDYRSPNAVVGVACVAVGLAYIGIGAVARAVSCTEYYARMNDGANVDNAVAMDKAKLLISRLVGFAGCTLVGGGIAYMILVNICLSSNFFSGKLTSLVGPICGPMFGLACGVFFLIQELGGEDLYDEEGMGVYAEHIAASLMAGLATLCVVIAYDFAVTFYMLKLLQIVVSYFIR